MKNDFSTPQMGLHVLLVIAELQRSTPIHGSLTSSECALIRATIWLSCSERRQISLASNTRRVNAGSAARSIARRVQICWMNADRSVIAQKERPG